MNGYALYRKAWRYDGSPHKETRLQEREVRRLLRQGGLLVRNTFDFDLPSETDFWYVIKDRYQGLDELDPRTRNKIRHALQAFEYQIIEIKTLYNEGYPIIEETYADYPVHDRPMSRKIFEEYLRECERKRFNYWGIIEKESNKLVGFCTVRLWEDSCEYGVTAVRTKYKSQGYYPYYGLYHTLNQHYLEERGFRYVSDGTRSITEHSNIHDFLIQNFKFRKAYCRLEVHYQWWMRLAVNMLYPFRKKISNPNVKAILNMKSMESQPD